MYTSWLIPSAWSNSIEVREGGEIIVPSEEYAMAESPSFFLEKKRTCRHASNFFGVVWETFGASIFFKNLQILSTTSRQILQSLKANDLSTSSWSGRESFSAGFRKTSTATMGHWSNHRGLGLEVDVRMGIVSWFYVTFFRERFYNLLRGLI